MYFCSQVPSALLKLKLRIVTESNTSSDLAEGIVVDEETVSVCVEDIHTLASGLSLSQAVMSKSYGVAVNDF